LSLSQSLAFPLKKLINFVPYNLSHPVCQKIDLGWIHIIHSASLIFHQMGMNLGQAHLFFPQFFYLLNDRHILEGVPSLSPFGSQRNQNAFKLSLPKTQGGFGDLKPQAEVLNTYRLFLGIHNYYLREC